MLEVITVVLAVAYLRILEITKALNVHDEKIYPEYM